MGEALDITGPDVLWLSPFAKEYDQDTSRTRVAFHVSAWGVDHVLAALSGLGHTGFPGTEVYADTISAFEGRAHEFRALLEITNIKLAGIHSGGTLIDRSAHDSELEEWTRLLGWTRDCGGDYAVYYGGAKTNDPDQDVAAGAELLNRIGDKAREVGVTFCYEPKPRGPIQTEEALNGLVDATDGGTVHLSIDTAHLAEMGLDPALFLVSGWNRLGVVHLRDIRGPDDERRRGADNYVEPGAGTVDMVQASRTLEAFDYDGWVVGVVENPLDGALNSARATAKCFREELGLSF